jgi:hypothetical protein
MEGTSAAIPTFEPNRARLEKPDWFPRFVVPDQAERLADTDLDPDELIVIIERGERRRALLVRQLAFHQAAQGTLGGEPFVATFCSTCHAGVAITPVLDGRTYHLSCGGVYNGMALLIDDETKTYWNHLRGEGLTGPLAGKIFPTWSPIFTTKKASLAEWPNLEVSLSRPSLLGKVIAAVAPWAMRSRGIWPPMYRATVGPIDQRLAKFTDGLGVVAGSRACFYPLERIGIGVSDKWDGRFLNVTLPPETRIPGAVWEGGKRPLQFFVRWYAFSSTYPGCEIYARA